MQSKSIVITGVNGFVGHHLAKELSERGHKVIGVGRDDSPSPSVASLLTKYVMADLTDQWIPLHQTIDAVVHLAGLAAVGPSFENPQEYITANSAMVTNMCEYFLKNNEKPRIVIVSSGAVYDSTQPMPIDESSPVTFGSPYAVSKILNENQAAYYSSRGLDCVVMRPFNHIGPMQLPGFIVPDLFKKIQERGSENDPIAAGNLFSKRDYTDVRDVARAYSLVATSPEKPRELIYNVCSGKSFSGEDVLNAVAAALNVPTPDVSVDQNLLRPNDIPDIRGANSRIAKEFDWQPIYSFQGSINDFVDAQSL